MEWDVELDCEGLLCPLPVLKARKRLRSMAPGAVLCVRATDPMAALDLPHFCAETGHAFLGAREDGGTSRYLIRVGGADAALLAR
ncbi:MAG: sulfurtransferase TusA family protein [Tabrizicola sp.]|nr:sulfurtransferase TusA family protein [Tabrizicola sp.]